MKVKFTNKISIKWKVFGVFFIFTIILVSLLWLIQVVYLNSIYRSVKRSETKSIVNQVQSALYKDDPASLIDQLAISNGIGIFVTNISGDTLYNAEYIPNSRISSIPSDLFNKLYDQAVAGNGDTTMEFKGSQPKKDINNDNPHPTPKPYDTNQAFANNQPHAPSQQHDQFRQNIGADFAESIVYVRVANIQGTECVIFVNSLLTPVDATVSTLKKQLVIITILIVIISFILALIFSRNITKSLLRMQKEALNLASGNYNVSFNEHDYKEISQLSDTLNYAASELGKTDRLQKELIANVSHDLRTPLTMIKGFSEVMRDLPGENTPENAQVIIDETERLTGLVNDMLDISKLSAGTIELEPTEYNLTNSIREVLKRYNKLQEQDGYIINFDYDEDIEVSADEAKIYQVLYNLINNAINYTGDDKQVFIRQICMDNAVRIEVTDTGNGISTEDIPYVWDRYYKVDKAHKRAVKGTGLGLSIVKNILELHHATYGVTSSEGLGCTFYFELNYQNK